MLVGEISMLRRPLAARPIDLDHLGRQTLGSDALRRDVLGLFLDHSAAALRLVAEGASSGERREAAHAIVGSALGIGAFRVADAAAEVERGTEPTIAKVAELQRAVAEARNAILALLAE
jgi:HPt (histidine-containing phosphotransfer) domain-containing protein